MSEELKLKPCPACGEYVLIDGGDELPDEITSKLKDVSNERRRNHVGMVTAH